MDQTEKQIPIQHPEEEEEHHENGTSKMFRKVKAKAKKIKNSFTKQGQSHELDNHDVVGEDDGDDELEPEVIGAPVKGGVTGQPESLSHPIEANIPAPEKIVPPGTKVSPVVSSDYTKPIEPVPLQDTFYGHEALSDPVKTTDTSDKEERRAETRRDESREAHHEAMDVTSTFAPGGEDEYNVGQRKVNGETPKKLEEDPVAPGGGSDYLSDVSNYQSKANDLTHEGDGVPDITESFGSFEVTDDSSDQKSGFERDLPIRSHEVDRETESAIGKDLPVSFEGKSGDELEKDFPTRSHVFDMTTESGIDKDSPWRSHEFDLKAESGVNKNSPTGFGAESKTRLEEDSPRRIFESDKKTESEIDKNSPTGFGAELKTRLEEDSPRRIYESDQKTESEIDKNSPTGFGGELGAKMGEDFPTRIYESDQNKNSTAGLGSASYVGIGEDFPAESHELDLKNESGSGKESPMGFGGESGTSLGEDIPVKESHGYGEEPESELEKTFPARSDDVKVETELGRDLPTEETHDQYSTELSRPKERDAFKESRDSFEETRDESQEQQPSSYTDQISSATSTISNKAIAAKNAVASKLGYSGESPLGGETQAAGTFDEKLTPVKETGSTVTTELPLSGGGSGLEETQQGEEEKGVSGRDYLAEKLHRGGGEEKTTTKKDVEVTEEKIPTEKVLDEKEQGEAVTEEVKGGGMVGMIKGWFGGGTAEEVKPKSPHSVEESSQSLGSTVGTKGFSDSGRSELGETGGGSGVVPVQRGLGN